WRNGLCQSNGLTCGGDMTIQTDVPPRGTGIAVSLIGAPSDAGAARLGAAMGPDALRVARLGHALECFGVDVRDLGNLAGPANPQAEPRDGLRHLTECVAWNKVVFDAVSAELAQGRVPIMLGGDHQLA